MIATPQASAKRNRNTRAFILSFASIERIGRGSRPHRCPPAATHQPDHSTALAGQVCLSPHGRRPNTPMGASPPGRSATPRSTDAPTSNAAPAQRSEPIKPNLMSNGASSISGTLGLLTRLYMGLHRDCFRRCSPCIYGNWRLAAIGQKRYSVV